MKLLYEFEVPVRAVAWNLQKRMGRLFLDSATQQFKSAVRCAAVSARKRGKTLPLPIEVCLNIDIFLHYSNTLRMQNEAGEWRARVPDLTNIQKAIEDALKGIVFQDDIQTAAIHMQRWRVGSRKDEKIKVVVYALNGEESNFRTAGEERNDCGRHT